MVRSDHDEASSNGRTADFGSAYEGSNPSASAKPHGSRSSGQREEGGPLLIPSRFFVVVLGSVPSAVVNQAGRSLTEVYGPPVVVTPPQQSPAYAFNKVRNQFHATAILRRLSQLRGGDLGIPIVGITDADLFLPDATFVFGDADRDSQAAVVSLARLTHGLDGRTIEGDQLRRRVAVETVHELGHLLGLAHCQDIHCAMFLSHRPSDADRKAIGLCDSCRAGLALP